MGIFGILRAYMDMIVLRMVDLLCNFKFLQVVPTPVLPPFIMVSRAHES